MREKEKKSTFEICVPIPADCTQQKEWSRVWVVLRIWWDWLILWIWSSIFDSITVFYSVLNSLSKRDKVLKKQICYVTVLFLKFTVSGKYSIPLNETYSIVVSGVGTALGNELGELEGRNRVHHSVQHYRNSARWKARSLNNNDISTVWHTWHLKVNYRFYCV